MAVYLAIGVYLWSGLWTMPGWLYRSGNPAGSDFLQIWTASFTALHGNPAMIFDLTHFKAAEEAVIKGSFSGYLPWHYPPTFLLLALPAALIPYLVSFALWMGLTLGALIKVLTRIAPHPLTPRLVLAFSPLALNLYYGQGAFFVVALLGGGLLLLDSQDIIAGLLFGVLINYKPHLGLLILLALAVGKYWRALGAMAAITLILALASYGIFGRDLWMAFFGNLAMVRMQLEGASNLWNRMPTIFAAIRLAGGGLDSARVWQILFMIGSGVAVVQVWRRPSPRYLQASVLAVAALLFTPHAFEYDLLLLALPISWLAWEGVRNGWRRGDQMMLMLIWLSPSLDSLTAKWAKLHVEPVILSLFLVFLLVRGGIIKHHGLQSVIGEAGWFSTIKP